MNPLDLNKESEVVKSTTDDTNHVQSNNIDTDIELTTTENLPELTEAISTESKTADISSEKVELIVTDSVEGKIAEKTDETEKKADYSSFSKDELIIAFKSLLEKDVEAIKDEVEIIKQTFYKKLKSDNEEQKKLFVEAGADELDFIPLKDESEDTFKALLNDFKTQKATLTAQKEKEKEHNLLQKQHVLEQMKVLADSNDDVSTHIGEFKNLQHKWKSIGHVPAQFATELWKQYNSHQEAFWDLIKINNELREYDFRKNLESKTLLCESAEKLDEEQDVIVAFHKLQKLHEEWHETGPVSRELRDEIWARFRQASSIINKKHQAYFDGVRKLEEENLVLKTALCEKIEAFDFNNFSNYKEWDEGTKTVLNWQDEWRSIGFAPRKENQKIYDRYRKLCDAFFTAKAKFYKESKNVLTENLEKKKALCKEAEALKDSTDWKETSSKMIQLQKEWKSIGPVPKKNSEDIWKEFIAACDFYFEQKNKANSGQKAEEAENLTIKKDIISKINLLEEKLNSSESLTQLRALMAEWNGIGHVPFKEKDKMYKAYRAAVDKQFERLNIDASQRRIDNFKSNLKDMSSKGENKLYREREKLVRAYEHLKSEISTYENNIGFFTSSSKKGGGLIKEMERKIEALKEESRLIETKINLIDQA
jgi:hypothetical protein